MDADWAVENHPGLTVAILGPAFIDSPGTYTWNALVAIGTGYTYDWQYSEDQATWYQVSTASSYQRYVDDTQPDFWLRLRIWAEGRTNWTTQGVNVNICPSWEIAC